MLRNINGWQLFIIILAVIILIGWKQLPNAARSLGRSMRIFKSEVEQMGGDKEDKPSAASSDTVDGRPRRDTDPADTDPADTNPADTDAAPSGHPDTEPYAADPPGTGRARSNGAPDPSDGAPDRAGTDRAGTRSEGAPGDHRL